MTNDTCIALYLPLNLRQLVFFNGIAGGLEPCPALIERPQPMNFNLANPGLPGQPVSPQTLFRKITQGWPYLWKIPLCGILFFLGFIPGNWLAAWLGLPTPPLPAGADSALVFQYTILGSFILALALALLSTGLVGPYLIRWLVLFLFVWIGYGINTYLEAAIFSTMASASFYTVILYLPASLLCSAMAAWLFTMSPPELVLMETLRSFWAQRPVKQWAWRLPLAYLAFPIAYLFFGSLISPIVLPYYQQGFNELALPGWGQILPTLALRSLLFLLICLPVLVIWQSSNWRLFIVLAVALFIVVGGLGMLEAYWLPAILRVTHSLEILADEVTYAAALVILLGRPNR